MKICPLSCRAYYFNSTQQHNELFSKRTIIEAIVRICHVTWPFYFDCGVMLCGERIIFGEGAHLPIRLVIVFLNFYAFVSNNLVDVGIINQIIKGKI